MKCMNVKPKFTKTKFSKITGSDIYYNGKSQKSLLNYWTALTAKCSVLMKEVVQIQRKMLMAHLVVNYGSDNSGEELKTATETAKIKYSKPMLKGCKHGNWIRGPWERVGNIWREDTGADQPVKES